MSSLRRAPSLGSIVLLVLLVIALVSGDDEETEPDRERPRAERPDRNRDGGAGRPGDAGRGGRAGDDDGSSAGSSGEGGAGSGAGGPVVPVVDVVDGDTIEVSFGGEVEDVRYIGVDTPESVAPGQPVECFGPEASEANERLVGGERVRLVFDAERRDVYERLLAYVYLEPSGRFVNAALVRRGFAETLTIAPNDRFAGLFARLQQAAANAGRGLWDEC